MSTGRILAVAVLATLALIFANATAHVDGWWNGLVGYAITVLFAYLAIFVAVLP